MQLNNERSQTPTITQANNDVRRRGELEAKLLAYRCGWLASDEIHVRRLKRELARLLDESPADDRLARALLD